MAQAARLNLRMQKEIKLLVTDPPPGVSLPFLSAEDSSSSSWASIEARLNGPEGTVYCEGFFTLMIQIPERYPFQPPNVTFSTPIYHPNIDNGGRICLDILNLPPKGAWQPSLNISTVLTSIGLLLTEPNPDDGLMAEASREYKYNRKVFDEKARYLTQRYANPVTAEKDIDDKILPNLKMEAKQPSSLANLPPSEVSTADVHSGKSVAETEGSRKKLRLMGGRLSLKSAIPDQKSSTESKEDMERNHAQSIADGVIRDGDEKVIACKEQEYLQGDREEMLKENCNPVEEIPVDMRTVIVADSEESDEEVVRPYRSRHSLLQKRRLSKC